MAFTCIVASVEHLRKQAPRKHSVSFPWPPHIDVYIPAFSDKLRHKYIRLRCFYYAQCNRLRYRKFRWISNNSTSKLQNDRIVFEMRLIFCTHLLWASTWTVSTTDWDFFIIELDFFALGRYRDFCQLKRKSQRVVLIRKSRHIHYVYWWFMSYAPVT